MFVLIGLEHVECLLVGIAGVVNDLDTETHTHLDRLGAARVSADPLAAPVRLAHGHLYKFLCLNGVAKLPISERQVTKGAQAGILDDPPNDLGLVLRARQYLAATEEAQEADAPKLKTSEDFYNHGVVLMVELGDLREGIMPEDLEAAVRLALVDLDDLQGLPLPSQ